MHKLNRAQMGVLARVLTNCRLKGLEGSNLREISQILAAEYNLDLGTNTLKNIICEYWGHAYKGGWQNAR